ncbi:uncharacterized protein EV420DRAFT_653384 [Desarmillaria tabescens]|uniref:RING-type domain-containing protein n=1 Tax=Armillaria tabescens TaxID=1929756 RepID=A0AA39TQE9_ARMTA|nr:uncharacterized protein EV420DRAFT_653384 [Desarmillaria tabescens]KAK0466902.1 hypothetical protein EV420DRAFT_653384 [Desarmillaria tabescens]
MSDQCTICRHSYTEPASIPCGHVYCLKCISSHILSSSPDGFTATCPACKTEFPIVLPEVSASSSTSLPLPVFFPQLHTLPEKFYRYVAPSVRFESSNIPEYCLA